MQLLYIATVIELKSVDNLSLYFNFKEKLKQLICYFDFFLKNTKNEDFSMDKNCLTTKRQGV